MNRSQDINTASFTPMLYLKNVVSGIEFYQKAFNAEERRRWANPDGSVHVAEMSLGNVLFLLHDETPGLGQLSPQTLNGTTVVIGLFVADPDAVMAKAVAAGASETSATRDYEYGYRQGNITDPFGHHWLIEKKPAQQTPVDL